MEDVYFFPIHRLVFSECVCRGIRPRAAGRRSSTSLSLGPVRGKHGVTARLRAIRVARDSARWLLFTTALDPSQGGVRGLISSHSPRLIFSNKNKNRIINPPGYSLLRAVSTPRAAPLTGQRARRGNRTRSRKQSVCRLALRRTARVWGIGVTSSCCMQKSVKRYA